MKSFFIKLTFFVPFLCFFPPAYGDDHLLPEWSVFSNPKRLDFSEHHKSLKLVFNTIYEQEVFGRVIVTPPFKSEYAIALSRQGANYKISLSEPEIRISQYLFVQGGENIEIEDEEYRIKFMKEIRRQKELFPKKLEDIPVSTCEIALDKSLGEMLYTLWGEMLFRTRYKDKRPVMINGGKKDPGVLDGIQYHFSFEYAGKTLVGKTWSPRRSSVVGKMVSITDKMRKACLSQNPTYLIELTDRTQNLLKVLSQSEY